MEITIVIPPGIGEPSVDGNDAERETPSGRVLAMTLTVVFAICDGIICIMHLTHTNLLLFQEDHDAQKTGLTP